MTHPVWGIPVFLGIMALVFFFTFTVGDFLKGYFESGLNWFSASALTVLQGLHASDWVISLVVDGVIAGVGGVLTFLPNIFILFMALAFLEDSGYMSRVAYVMNETMGMVGLSGKAFLPMLLGFGCTVPAVMATRALESVKDRRRTILITPFMSCSARLPIYVLFSEMFFPQKALLVAYSLYVIGLAVAILVAYIVHRSSNEKYDNILPVKRIHDHYLQSSLPFPLLPVSFALHNLDGNHILLRLHHTVKNSTPVLLLFYEDWNRFFLMHYYHRI